jgi:hypothetical protein
MNRSFDERFGYRTKSMLVVPMVDHRGRHGRRAAAHQPQGRDPDARVIRDEASAARTCCPYDDGS